MQVYDDEDDFGVQKKETRQMQSPGHAQMSPGHAQSHSPVTRPEVSSQALKEEPTQDPTRYPSRNRRRPEYLRDYACEVESDDQTHLSIDYCYRVMCGVPLTFREAVNSSNSEKWVSAMDEEMQSLRENKTFTLTNLPEGKDVVGGRWVYTIKNNVDGSDKYKARYVAKGYSQKMGVDYDETFSPTANLTSVRVLMQKAAQENLILHQMDVKTAYLHAPIDYEIYIEQPEGYEEEQSRTTRLVYRLEKSLYGLKQSGRNWNKLLDEYLTNNKFVQNPADHCVYIRETEKEKVILIIWVDDLIIAASDENAVMNVKEFAYSKIPHERFRSSETFSGH